MKKLINTVDAVVREQLMGMAAAHPELKVRIEPHFITRADSPVAGKVAIISGGGSGHEPMHGGLVGKGMLDGACPGEVFTSPTPDQMYECARAVDGGAGVLFLVKNYTGDVLNFETAVELLHGDGIKVAFALIDDDVAVKDSLYTAGRRGVAATVLIEKMVGAAAEAGYNLEQCEALAQRINNRSRSIGVALHACTVPAAGKPSFTMADNEMEFGVGIHGEPGIARRTYTDLNTLVDQLFANLLENSRYTRTLRTWDRSEGVWQEEAVTVEDLQSGDRVLALVNSLGGTPLSELYGVYGRFSELCEKSGLHLVRNMIGPYCTSLDMTGISITLVKMDDEMMTLWDAPVHTPALRRGC
ncbi:dihydroxyacetone kinase DhaK subunit [Aeromonas sp. RU39B]|uniref:dihydroxyacetone kinase subunit DhaK n=1 Tax=Aeromonas sp. RU39B TaxID=1907416 RepID=UPI0009556F83|nr:dihydroxyacetone kinase subunit DhaK [Aeromonas sp. RU39B]SIR60357.1 dihydroxyacetone kinase DhaK subunit [Aeromonas sp. RU39B]